MFEPFSCCYFSLCCQQQGITNGILEATSNRGRFKLSRPFLFILTFKTKKYKFLIFLINFPSYFHIFQLLFRYNYLPLRWPETRSSSHLYKPEPFTTNLICLLRGNRQWNHSWNWEISNYQFIASNRIICPFGGMLLKVFHKFEKGVEFILARMFLADLKGGKYYAVHNLE